MTYPPTNPGYPPTQPPGPYGAPAPSFAPAESGPSKLPLYLNVVVIVLGLAAYLASFGPILTIKAELGPFGGAELSGGGGGYPVVATIVAALLAAAALLPKARDYGGVIATASGVALLTAIATMVGKPTGFTVGWGLWVMVALTLLQTVAAVTALLLEAGIITAPAPRPRYDQFGQYGPPPGGYYGQPGPQGIPPRPGYPTQYGGGYASGPTSGGFSGLGAQSGPPTPPTGFPSFSPPPPAGSGQPSAQPDQPQAPSSSPPSGPNPS
ncbi:putative transmembrane protein [Mycolicibacterium rhodesiae JS60]|nr:putative transmembrane protein [Mycolicibacterium rhodesiae JS60]